MSSEAVLNQLSVETRAKLRSAQLLISLPQIVSELLQNSLDAGASQVDIGINCEEWGCWVRDDGAGINKGGLTMIGKGSEEGRYNTSKAYTPASLESVSTFGFRGEALSSMAELCCLEISSRTSVSRESWSVILKGGKSLYSGPSIRWRRESAGTVVCVRDAFFNLPVRRQSHSSPAKTIDIIKQELEAYAIMFPNVSFTLQDDNKSRENDSSKGHVLRVPKTRSILAAFRHMYGRALIEHVEEVNATSGDLKVEGFISLVGAHSKIHQYLYINKHPISFCDIHRLIDSKFSTSTFMKHAYDEGGKTSLRSFARRSPRKAEKRPIYVLNLVIPTRHIDNCLEPAKSAVHIEHKNVVTSFLSSVIDSFLDRHGFASGKRRAEEDHESPIKKRKVMVESIIPNSVAPNITQLTPASRKSGVPALFIHPGEISEQIPQTTVWKDPERGETFIVDARSGNSYSQNSRHKVSETNTASMSRVTRIPRHVLKNNNDPGQGVASSGPTRDIMPDWLSEALSANKAFAITEPKIPSLPQFANQSTDDQNYAQMLSHNYSCCAHTFGTYLQSGSKSEHARVRFQKTDLLKAQVINQVDRKFIACLVDLDHSTHRESDIPLEKHPAGSTLVLIDQHAADERVRVERFLKEICSGFLQHCEGSGGVEVLELSPAVPILLTRHEVSRLVSVEEVQSAFARWGVRFEGLANLTSLEPEGTGNESNAGYAQVFIQAIPAIVGDKLLLNEELQDFVKGYLGTLESEEASSPNLSQERDNDLEGGDSESRWLKALRWCPRELLDLINSKACRGAVMFNDPLSLEQCERLVKHLAATSFPFQCAHGRPSLVPLTHVGTKSDRRTTPALDWTRLS